MKRLFSTAFLLGIILAVVAAVWLLIIYPKSSSSNMKPVEVTIARGSGGATIANRLAKENVITHPTMFRLLSRVKGVAGKFQAGEYVFEVGISPMRVIEKLSQGDIILRQVMVPEGKTSSEVVELINKAPELVGTIDKIPAEGSLLPNTYRYTKGETRASMIERMHKAHQTVKAELWEERVDGLPFSTWNEAVTLASIVEKETGIGSEREHVAGLYINRLRIGMLLQADPTVAYGAYGGQYADKPIRRSDLRNPNKYNTYIHKGLPPTPICNPGKAAIAAVLNPAKHDDLFMVATGTGGHYFSKTNKEHVENVKKYRAWQREQKRKQKQ